MVCVSCCFIVVLVNRCLFGGGCWLRYCCLVLLLVWVKLMLVVSLFVVLLVSLSRVWWVIVMGWVWVRWLC